MMLIGSYFFPYMFFFIIKTLECGVKLEIIHKITLKDTCTRPRKYEKADQKNSELLSRNARSEMRNWKWRLDRARKQRIPAPLFGSKSDENSDFEGVKQEEFDALRNGDFYYDYGSEFYSAGETKNLCYSRVNSEWRAVQCYTTHVQRNERSCSDVGPLRWSFGNFHGCSRGNIIWLGVQS